MKLEGDKEIDRLLQRHARRKGAGASLVSQSDALRGDGESVNRGTVNAHLDADEMSAYAENVLPVAARARYMNHLADCDQCRQQVTNLTLALNVPIKESAEQQVKSASQRSLWRAWLASLFAPPVIRYGVPALALVCAALIAFVALRQQRDQTLVARNEETQTSGDAQELRNENAPMQTTVTTASGVNQNSASANANTAANTTQPTPPPAKVVDANANSNVSSNEDTATTLASPPSPPASTEEVAGAGATTEQKTKSRRDDGLIVAGPPKPPPSAADLSVTKPAEVANQRREAERTQASEAQRVDSTTSTTTTDVARSRDRQNSQSESNVATRPSASSGARARTARRNSSVSGAEGRAQEKDERSSETRTVAGRQFRRQGGAWVDTAYSSGRALTNVSRGSEQYRALIADEPGIRQIADQLGGTVILVWKGRAYRIH